MLAPSRQPPRTEPPLAPLPQAPWSLLARQAPALAALLGFFCFMPYMAIPVGSSTAIQFGTILTVLLTSPFLVVTYRRGPLWIFLLLLAPLCLSTLKVAIAGDGDLSLCFKTVPVWALSCLSMVAVQVCAPRYALHLLTGIAIATIIHAGVGLLQIHGFASGEFPLAWLYVNPSFLSVQDNAEIIARYTQRPFGLFPSRRRCRAAWPRGCFFGSQNFAASSICARRQRPGSACCSERRRWGGWALSSRRSRDTRPSPWWRPCFFWQPGSCDVEPRQGHIRPSWRCLAESFPSRSIWRQQPSAPGSEENPTSATRHGKIAPTRCNWAFHCWPMAISGQSCLASDRGCHRRSCMRASPGLRPSGACH